jgi:methyl-accepting chemotaxis protein
MTWLSNFSIGRKLRLGFGVVLVLTCLLGGFSIFEISKVNGNTVDIATHWLSSVQTLGDLGIQVSSFRRNELNYALSVDDQMKQSIDAGMKDALAQIDKSEKLYEPLMSSEEERRLYNDFRSDWDKYLNIHTRVMELLRTNKTEAAARLASTEERLAFVARPWAKSAMKSRSTKRAPRRPRIRPPAPMPLPAIGLLGCWLSLWRWACWWRPASRVRSPEARPGCWR